MKNPQFLANQAQTLVILCNHEMVTLTKFHDGWMKIVDFSLMPNFRASPIFYYSPFRNFCRIELHYMQASWWTLFIFTIQLCSCYLALTMKEIKSYVVLLNQKISFSGFDQGAPWLRLRPCPSHPIHPTVVFLFFSTKSALVTEIVTRHDTSYVKGRRPLISSQAHKEISLAGRACTQLLR